MPEENSAVEFHKKLTDGKLPIGDIELIVRVLEGEEEEQYLNKTSEILSQRREKLRGNKRQQRKRKGKFSDDGPQSKKSD